MRTATARLGTGCPTLITGLPIHNPPPSTPRGRRRNPSRFSTPDYKRALATDRSTQLTRYQKRLQNSA